MKTRRIILALLTTLAAIPAMGQGRQVLTDGISGRDRVERLQFIQVFSPQSDTCFVVSDSLGHFEVDPDLMLEMRGNVYLKPLVSKPRPKLTLVNPFDSIDSYRQDRTRYLSQNHFVEVEREELFSYDHDVTVLSEARVKARGNIIAQDKVTGYLDSLAILASGEWVCEDRPGVEKYLNDYRGYSHHPNWSHEGLGAIRDNVKHLMPKRGERYTLIRYEPDFPGSENGHLVEVIYDYEYPGPQYNEEELLEMYGMSKAQGYHSKREFYEPDALDLASPTPDYRNLLQWRPAVLTDENGVAEIPFAASDVNTEFIGLVEAVDGMGLIGAQTFTFGVLK